jgi:hypothetical protein
MRQKIITLSIIIFLSSMLIFSVLLISTPAERLHRQILKTSSPQISSSSKSSDTQGELSKIHGVKIVSPIRGQKVPAYKNLTIIGNSIANSTSNCIVSITLNGITPYQRVTPIGPNGTNDYSLWGFVATPKYASVKEGANQLKAKFSCVDNPTLLSYYTTNITGIATSTNTTTTTPITSNTTTRTTINNTSNELQ